MMKIFAWCNALAILACSASGHGIEHSHGRMGLLRRAPQGAERALSIDVDINLNVSTGWSRPMRAVESYKRHDFVNEWDYFAWPDPTHGNVTYVSRDRALQAGLVGITRDGRFKMAVSTGNLFANRTRESVRITSKRPWKKGQLLVGSFSHMPTGCGTWPAFWSVSKNYGTQWPKGGELDIIEGINSVPKNVYVVHTLPGCTMHGKHKTTKADFSNSVSDCNSAGGCVYKDRRESSFGPAYNAVGGGVSAAYFDDTGLRLWSWKKNEVPLSLSLNIPILADLGTPQAWFESDTCSMAQFMDEKQTIIINTTLFGDWAGNPEVYAASGCPNAQKVMDDPTSFEEAYWLVDHIKIFA